MTKYKFKSRDSQMVLLRAKETNMPNSQEALTMAYEIHKKAYKFYNDFTKNDTDRVEFMNNVNELLKDAIGDRLLAIFHGGAETLKEEYDGDTVLEFDDKLKLTVQFKNFEPLSSINSFMDAILAACDLLYVIILEEIDWYDAKVKLESAWVD